MEALMKHRFSSFELPEAKLLRLAKMMEGSSQDFPDRCADFAVLYGYDLLEGFGHRLACSLQGAAFEGLKQVASTWGLYLAKEVESFFHWQLLAALSDLIFDLSNIFCQIPAKELGEAIRESVTPAYLRASETVAYELALFDNNTSRIKESLEILEASDAELEREIANMFRGYSSARVGKWMQQGLIRMVSLAKQFFSSRNVPDEELRTALLTGCKNLSWYIGRRLSQNLQHDPQRTKKLLEAIGHHGEITAIMEQYRYRYGWQGDRNKAVVLAYQVVAPRYFGLSGQIQRIREDEQQEKLIGVAEGLEDYTNKNPAIDALTDGLLGKLGTYLAKAAENQATDYARKQGTDGNIILTEAKHVADLHSQDEEGDGDEDEVSIDEVLSQEKEKRHPSGDPVAEEVEAKEITRAWYSTLTGQERTAVELKVTLDNEEKIARRMGISQQRVSQLLGQALKKWHKFNR
jgi:RNA polymerase sigma factor (sigma-70 family)